MELSASMGVVRPSNSRLTSGPIAPVALGLVPDLVLEAGRALVQADLAADFTGAGLTIVLAPGSPALPAGLVLTPQGLLSGIPQTPTGPLTLTLRASNTAGSADSEIGIRVEAVVGPTFTADIAGLVPNATFGPSAQSGVELTASASAFSGAVPGSLSYQWRTLEHGPIAGETSAAFTPDAATLSGQTLYCTISAAGYPDSDTPGAVVRHAPPIAAGGLVDEILDLDSGLYQTDASTDFTGAALVFSATGPGVGINPSTGLLSIRTDSPTAGSVVTVTAQNSGGSATSAFQLTVEVPEVEPGPDVSLVTLDDVLNEVVFSIGEDATVYWKRDPLGTNPDAADIIAGGGYDSGSFAVTSGSNAVDVTFAGGNDGVQQLSLVVATVPSQPSIVRSVVIDIDTVAPVLQASAPSAGGTGVSTAVTPTLTFSETVEAGTGTVTIYDVTGASALEVFDVITQAGSGAGQVEVVDTTLTIRPSSPLQTGRQYAILIDAGALTDTAGNPFAGIADTATLSFSTGAGV